MNEDDYIQGCYSGIQKAIRRGDLNLAYTCFESLWSEKEHRNWLKWRMTSIIQEDAYPLVGWLADTYPKLKGTDEVQEKRGWKKLVYLVTLAPKQKDGSGLKWVSLNTKRKKDEHPELKMARKWLAPFNKEGGDPAKVAADLFDHLVNDFPEDFSEYEKGALTLLKARAERGGMLSDRQCSIATMILIASRGLDKEDVQTVMRKSIEPFEKSGMKPLTVNLPWYTFDVHTVAGKMATTALSRRFLKGYEKSDVEGLWFFAESAYTPKELAGFSKLKAAPTPWDCMWWPIAMKERLACGGKTAKEHLSLWRTKWSKHAEELVNWALEKRAE
jgi:hypothetical protein